MDPVVGFTEAVLRTRILFFLGDLSPEFAGDFSGVHVCIGKFGLVASEFIDLSIYLSVCLSVYICVYFYICIYIAYLYKREHIQGRLVFKGISCSSLCISFLCFFLALHSKHQPLNPYPLNPKTQGWSKEIYAAQAKTKNIQKKGQES